MPELPRRWILRAATCVRCSATHVIATFGCSHFTTTTAAIQAESGPLVPATLKGVYSHNTAVSSVKLEWLTG